MLSCMKNVLVVASHPDDEVLGCGGTLFKLKSFGVKVRILILGEGVTSRFSRREQADQTEVLELKNTALKVGAFLGAENTEFGDLPDNRFDTLALLDIVKIIENCIHRYKPDTIFCQHGGDLNIDHQITFQAVLTATRPLQDHCVKHVLAFEVASSTEWSFGKFEPRFSPNYFVDIGDLLEKKIEALKFYESEERPFPHPRSSESLAAMAKYWGKTCGIQACEAFEIIRSIG